MVPAQGNEDEVCGLALRLDVVVAWKVIFAPRSDHQPTIQPPLLLTRRSDHMHIHLHGTYSSREGSNKLRLDASQRFTVLPPPLLSSTNAPAWGMLRRERRVPRRVPLRCSAWPCCCCRRRTPLERWRPAGGRACGSPAPGSAHGHRCRFQASGSGYIGSGSDIRCLDEN